jgi:hypothetical protein
MLYRPHLAEKEEGIKYETATIWAALSVYCLSINFVYFIVIVIFSSYIFTWSPATGETRLKEDPIHVLWNCKSIKNLFITYLNVQTVLTHTYHSRFIPEGVAEASQIFLRDTFYQN